MWLAWWMVHDDSHSTLRASADISSRRLDSIAMAAPGQAMVLAYVILLSQRKISNFCTVPADIGIFSQHHPIWIQFIPMPQLDAIDRKILSHLQSDGRITMQELADKVGLSVSPCHRRVKLLEE